MIYNNLILNSSVYKKLTSFYNLKRLPNAFIFYGNDGVGKEAHAIEFFGLLNCEKKDDNKACGLCKSCRKTKNLQHEFLEIITPLPRKKTTKNGSSFDVLTDKQRIEFIEQIKKKSLEPYHKIEIEKANTILINSIKGIKKGINLSIPKSKTKLYLIFDAEKLCYPNQEAANALLKILEEPNENHLFILVTSNINKIIDTIVSRCIPIYFNKIDKKKLEDLIKKTNNLNNDKAKIISKICMGNMRYAQVLCNSYDNKINLIQSLITYLKNDNLSKWNESFKNMNKKNILEILDLLIISFKDLKIFKINSDKIYLSDCYELYNNFLKKFSNINIDIIIKTINNCQNYIQKNGHQPLMVLALFLELKNSIKNKKNSNFDLNQWTLYNE